MVSEKQRKILLENGYTETGINEMSYKQISDAIGDILARKGRPKGEPQKVQPQQPSNGAKEYHLSPEQVRYNALDIAQRIYPQSNTPAIIGEAEKIERWMLRLT